MPKRKRGTEKPGVHLAQESSTHPPVRKSARLLERDLQTRENGQCRTLSSLSTTGLIREDCRPTQLSENNTEKLSSREDHYPTYLSENNTEKLTNNTSFKSHFVGLDTGNKRKLEKELGQTSTESRKRPRKSEPAAASLNLSPKEQLELSGDGLSKNQKTSIPFIESPEKPAEELGARETEQKERYNPISYWAAHSTWPEDFAAMASSNSTNKRQRTSDSQSGQNERPRSYSQSRKDIEVPEQYTAAYEVHILTKGLDMDCRKGRDFVSEESKKTCVELSQIKVDTIEPTAVPQDKIIDILYDCQARNEAIVQRDVTPLMIPSIRLRYYCGASHLEHVIDEVNADWYSQCVLEGPQLRPDLAIGLLSSAFTEKENDKLKRYFSVKNWTQVTLHMLFPFLMCEVKCGREGLDIADQQNMHSCSVAVRAILRIEQEADKYRSEKKMDSLSGQVLVFSISHDQQDTHLHGHYAIIQREKWTYHRYRIRGFHLTDNNSLLAIHNFVRNILKSHLPGHVRRLKDALAALPDPNKPLESSGLPGSSGLSFTTSGISLNDDNSQQDSQDRDAQGFVVPPRPDSPQNGEAKKKGRKSSATTATSVREQLLEQQLEDQKQDQKQEKQQMNMQLNALIQQIQTLNAQLDKEREESRKREERQKEEMEKLLQRLIGKASN